MDWNLVTKDAFISASWDNTIKVRLALSPTSLRRLSKRPSTCVCMCVCVAEGGCETCIMMSVICVKYELVALLPARPCIWCVIPRSHLPCVTPFVVPFVVLFIVQLWRPEIPNSLVTFAEHSYCVYAAVWRCVHSRKTHRWHSGGGAAHRDNLMITPIPWCRAYLPRLLWLTLICLQRPVSTVVAVCFVSSTLTTICTHTRFSSPLARALLLSLLVSCSCRSPRKPGVFASASGDCTIKIWDSNAPRSMCTIAAHPHEVCGWSVAGCA